MARKPKTSTLNNFTVAWNRVVATAVKHGMASARRVTGIEIACLKRSHFHGELEKSPGNSLRNQNIGRNAQAVMKFADHG